MALDDDYTCPHHDGSIVVLFCYTCEELICAKCVSHGAAGVRTPGAGGPHTDHMYLDVQEAYDLKREEFEKVLAKFKDQLITKKHHRHQLHAKIQRLKLELLRRRTLVERKTRSLRDALRKKERGLGRQLEGIMSPSITLQEKQYQDLDFDVVVEDGIVGSAESLLRIQAERGVNFLKSAMKVKKSMEEVMKKVTDNVQVDTGACGIRQGDNKSQQNQSPELAQLSHLTSSFHRERATFRHAFTFDTEAPSAPRLLPGWCTISSLSASLIWKYSKTHKVSKFLLYYHPLQVQPADTKLKHPTPEQHELVPLGYKCVKFKRFTGGRTSMVLRDLSPGTTYQTLVYAVNDAGTSKPLSFFFTTACDSSSTDRRWCTGSICFNEPSLRKCSDCTKCTKSFIKILSYTLIAFYIAFSLAVILLHFNLCTTNAPPVSFLLGIFSSVWDILNICAQSLKYALTTTASNDTEGYSKIWTNVCEAFSSLLHNYFSMDDG